jgi:hypothetical protein
MRIFVLIPATFALLAATQASARGPAATGTPQNVQRLIGCRSITDSTQRLACFDREAAAMDQAIAKKDLVFIDKQKATQTKRALFGFSIPDFGGLFGGGDDEVKEIEGTVAKASQDGYGAWVVTLADGSTWAQQDDAPLGLGPRRGDKVVVHRGSFGAFFLRVAGQPGIRVKRIG